MTIPAMTDERVAMFFDCEGHRSKRGNICFTQKDPAMLLEVQQIWGGHLRVYRKDLPEPYYRLTLRKLESLRFIERIGPLSRKLSPSLTGH